MGRGLQFDGMFSGAVVGRASAELPLDVPPTCGPSHAPPSTDLKVVYTAFHRVSHLKPVVDEVASFCKAEGLSRTAPFPPPPRPSPLPRRTTLIARRAGICIGKGGRYPPQAPSPRPRHCPPDAKFQLRWHV